MNHPGHIGGLTIGVRVRILYGRATGIVGRVLVASTSCKGMVTVQYRAPEDDVDAGVEKGDRVNVFLHHGNLRKL